METRHRRGDAAFAIDERGPGFPNAGGASFGGLTRAFESIGTQGAIAGVTESGGAALAKGGSDHCDPGKDTQEK